MGGAFYAILERRVDKYFDEFAVGHELAGP